MTCIDSLNDENTFFIFRDNGVEVKINLTDNKVFADHELTEDEKIGQLFCVNIREGSIEELDHFFNIVFS